MMGAGKTTTGRAVANRLAAAYLDSDEQVERETGRGVAAILEADGEAAFRAAESAALRAALAAPTPVVVSVAGGAVLDPENRRRIAQAGTVVWLRARPETLAARVGDGEGRPLLRGDVAGNLARLDAVRRPLYAEVADAVVDVDGLATADVVDAICRAVGEVASS